MRTFAKSRIRYSKTQRIGIFAFILLLIGLQGLSYLLNHYKYNEEPVKVPEEVLRFEQALTDSKNLSTSTNYKLTAFDPNELSSEQWENLGFSAKQVSTILKYKYSLGGYFSTKDEIKDCYVISEKKYAEIEPYIFFKKRTSKNSSVSFTESRNQKILYENFNPNDYSQEDWQRIGFSQKQAATILKYKKLKGGKFISLEQIRDCYVISEEKFKEMKPYMILPVMKSKGEIRLLDEPTEYSPTKVLSELEKFNPNNLTLQEWVNLGFTEKQANTILNYKKSLGGKFKDAEDFKRCYALSAEKFEELKPYIVFDE